MGAIIYIPIIVGVTFVCMSFRPLRRWRSMVKRSSTYKLVDAKVAHVDKSTRGRYKITYNIKYRNKKGKQHQLTEKFFTPDPEPYHYGGKCSIYFDAKNPFLCFSPEQIKEEKNRFLGYFIGGIALAILLPLAGSAIAA